MLMEATLKTCRVCGETKPLDEFYATSGKTCKTCKIAYSVNQKRELYATNPDEHLKQKIRHRKNNLMRRYGLTVEEAEEMYAKDSCEICGKPADPGKLHNIDHCHKTGKVRGLLCSNHNRAIGLFNEDPELLMAAARYLQEHAA